MEHFETFASYVHFSLARDFNVKDDSQTPYLYPKNNCEKVGNLLSKPVLAPLDFSMRHGRNPLFIMALTIVGVFTATMLFYPAVVAGVISVTALLVIKIAAFTLIQTSIIGLGLRTFGRLNNPQLMDAWDRQNIAINKFGSIRI
jgi:hypothetical protein